MTPIEAGAVHVPLDQPRRGRPPKTDELERRLDVLESRQTEIVDVLAGVSQAGRWLKQQIEDGQA